MGGDGAADDACESNGGDLVSINLRNANGSKFSLEITLSSTVESLKEAVARKCEIPANQQRLIYKGRILKDDQSLQSYGLEADHTVHLVRGFAQSASTGAGNVTSNGPAETVAANPSVAADPNVVASFGGPGVGAALFPGLGLENLGDGGGGVGGGGGALFGIPDFEQVQQQLARNPNIIRELVNMPFVQNLMNNPEIMRNLIMNNPQMRDVMERNPELAHVLNDPGTLRQIIEAARNPELMREMVRNTDRAMSNIESSPEGFNMLRRMYETVQEPFLNATAVPGNAPAASPNPLAAIFGSQETNVSQDGSPNPLSSNSDTTTVTSVPNTNPLPNPWTATSGGGGGAQTTAARSNPSGNVRAQGAANPGGLSEQELGHLFGGMSNANLMNQAMQNPAMLQMVQAMLSNPQQLSQIVDFNHHLRENLQTNENLRQFFSPDAMQNFFAIQQALMPQSGQQQPTQETRLTDAGAGATANNNAGLEMLMSMFGALGAGSLTGQNTTPPNVVPEELYATQLSQLQEMGFFDTQENIRALMATAGNVHAAVERLLGSSGH